MIALCARVEAEAGDGELRIGPGGKKSETGGKTR